MTVDFMQKIADFGGNNTIPDQVQFTFPLLHPLQEERHAELVQPTEYRFGPHSRHNLDVYLPEGLAEKEQKPVLVYVYGGGFIQGDKRACAGEYIALGDYYSRKGFVTVIVDYRRVPEGKFPDGAEDLSLALQWLAKGEIKEADLNNVFMLGASAGGIHLSSLIWGSYPNIKHPSGIQGIQLRGIMFLSIKYHGEGLVPEQHPVSLYYGSPQTWQDNSPQSLRSRSTDKTPLLAFHATYDPEQELKRDVPGFLELYRSRKDDFGAMETYECEGHNHISLPLVLGLGGPGEDWAEYSVQWMQKIINQ